MFVRDQGMETPPNHALTKRALLTLRYSEAEPAPSSRRRARDRYLGVSASYTVRSSPLTVGTAWGFSLWDRERLVSLVPRPQSLSGLPKMTA